MRNALKAASAVLVGFAVITGSQLLVSCADPDNGPRVNSECDEHGNRVYYDSRGSVKGVTPDEECAR